MEYRKFLKVGYPVSNFSVHTRHKRRSQELV